MGMITKLILILACAFIVMMMGVRTHASTQTKPAKGDEVIVTGKKPEPVKKAAPKKNDSKIKPLAPNRKVPTLKKKYRKD